MVREANAAMELATSTSCISHFVRQLVEGYTRNVLDYEPKRDPRAIGFSCHGTTERRSCRVPEAASDGASRRRILRGTQCQFTIAGHKRSFVTLHEASRALDGFINGTPSSPPRPTSQQQAVLPQQLMAQTKATLCPSSEREDGRRTKGAVSSRSIRHAGDNGAGQHRWCFQQRDAASCRSLYVRSADCQGRPMACVWMEDLQSLNGKTLDTVCPTIAAKLHRSGQCFPACCPALCNVTEERIKPM